MSSIVRIWDCFLFEGTKIIYRIYLAVLKINKKDLMKLDFGEAIVRMKEMVKEIEVETLIRTALAIRLSRGRIEMFRREYMESPKSEFVTW